VDISNFISPKQLIEIKREIVEQALARANPILALEYRDGILVMAENPSDSLNKISEIYDRIVFAGTGVYNDYERLRRAGVQAADLRGFSYSRSDVLAKSLASDFSSILGETFSRQQVPWEVEILVVELGEEPRENRMYVILYSGGLVEEKQFCVIGDIVRDKEGELHKNVLSHKLAQREMQGDEPLEEAFTAGYESLMSLKSGDEGIAPNALEAVVLDRTLKRQRKMRRLSSAEIEALRPGS
jgi:proteasome alpha subunit